MPMLKRADAEIHYEIHGAGFPILLYAPGGLKSEMHHVGRLLAGLSQRLSVDGSAHGAHRQVHRHRHGPAQRRQVGGRRQARPWLAHFRRRPSRADGPSRLQEVPRHGRLHRRQLLLRGDRAGARPRRRRRAAEPDRPVGEPRQLGRRGQGLWRDGARRDPSISQETINSFGRNMFGSDFVFSVTRDFVKNCRTPLYLQPGTDKPHPAHTSAEIAELAPNIEVQKDWRGPAFLQESIRRVHAFLARNTPKMHDAPPCSCGAAFRRCHHPVLGAAADLGRRGERRRGPVGHRRRHGHAPGRRSFRARRMSACTAS